VTPWYGPPNNTDRWQPIDAGYGKQVKDKAKEHYTTWWNLYVTHTHTHTHTIHVYLATKHHLRQLLLQIAVY